MIAFCHLNERVIECGRQVALHENSYRPQELTDCRGSYQEEGQPTRGRLPGHLRIFRAKPRQVMGIGTSGELGRSAMRKLRPVTRRTVARWPSRWRPAFARSGSPNSPGHSAGARLLMTMMLPFS